MIRIKKIVHKGIFSPSNTTFSELISNLYHNFIADNKENYQRDLGSGMARLSLSSQLIPVEEVIS